MDTRRSNPPRHYGFAGYRLDPGARALTRADEHVAIPPKSLECLIYLIENRDRAVGRDELISAVWGRTDVSYAVLAQTLWKMRRMLGDSQANPHIIRTVSRFGYQWVAPVQLLDPAETARASVGTEPPAAVTLAPIRRVRRRWPIVAVFVAGVVIVATAMIWHRTEMLTPAPTPATAEASPPGTKRFLVLPVASSVESSEGAWLRLGVMDYIAARLRESGGVQVLASDQVVAMLSQNPAFDADDPAQLRQLGLIAGASYVIVPRLDRVADAWKLSLAVHTSESIEPVEADAASPLLAANAAIDDVLRVAGIDAKVIAATPDRLTELIQRIDAAALAGDIGQALELAQSAPPELQRNTRLQLKLAQIRFRGGQIDAAEADFRALAQSHPNAADPTRIAAGMGLAAIAERRQRYDEAERGYSEAIAALGESGDPSLVGQAHMMRGLVNGYLNRSDQALADFGLARIALTRSGDQAGLANLDVAVGLTERTRGHYADAAQALDRAIGVYERFGTRDRLATALIAATGARLALLEFPQALALSERGWVLADTLESPVLINYLALVRGYALLATGQLRATHALLERMGVAADPDNPAAMPDLLLLRVSLLLAEGKGVTPEQAMLILERVEHPAERTYGTSVGDAVMTLVSGALRTDDVELAERLFERLRAAPNASDADTLRPLALRIVEAQIRAARRESGATELFTAALAAVDRNNYPDALVSVCVTWARYLQNGHDREAAAMVIGRLLPFVQRDFRAARAVAVLYGTLGERQLADAASASAIALAGERDPDASL